MRMPRRACVPSSSPNPAWRGGGLLVEALGEVHSAASIIHASAARAARLGSFRLRDPWRAAFRKGGRRRTGPGRSSDLAARLQRTRLLPTLDPRTPLADRSLAESAQVPQRTASDYPPVNVSACHKPLRSEPSASAKARTRPWRREPKRSPLLGVPNGEPSRPARPPSPQLETHQPDWSPST